MGRSVRSSLWALEFSFIHSFPSVVNFLFAYFAYFAVEFPFLVFGCFFHG